MSTLLTMTFLSLMVGRSCQALFKTTFQSMSSTKLTFKVSWELTATENVLLQNVGREDAQKDKKTYKVDERGNLVYQTFTMILS